MSYQHLIVSEHVALANALDPSTVKEMVETLRYIKREWDRYARLDATNVQHVVNALKLVDEDLDEETERETLRRAVP